jgi:SAM-dependent methyltransferase
MDKLNNYNNLDFENLTFLGRLIYPWAIKSRNQLAIRNIPKNTKALLDFGGGYGYLIKNTTCPKAISIDEKAKLSLLRDMDGKIINENYSDGFLFSDKIPFEDECFDCITAIAIIEHIKNIKLLIEEFHRILRASGTLIITTPSRIVDKILPLLDKGSNQLRGKKVSEEHEHSLNREKMQKYTKNMFQLQTYRRFQFGLNQLFVYKKINI